MDELKASTAKVLLEAITKAAPTAGARGSEALESLARAYAAVAGAAPKPKQERGGTVF